MAIYADVAGVKKTVLTPSVNVGGAWKKADRIFGKTGGQWYLIWPQPAKVNLVGSSPTWESVKLDWAPTGVIVETYQVVRGSTILLDSTTALTFTDTGLMPATAYQYTVNGYRGGVIAATETVNVTTATRQDLGLVGSSPAYDKADLSWTDPSGGGVTGYRVKRGGVTIYSGAAKACQDTGLSSGSTYTYTLEALRSGTVIPPSDTVSVTTGARPAMSMTATVNAWDRITLTWTDTVGDADTYTLKRGSTTLSSSITGATRTYNDQGALIPSTAYSYTLQAVRDGVVVGTATASGTTSAHPDLGLAATAASYSQINLSWSAKNGSVDSFELKRGSTVIYTGAGTSKSDTGLSASTTYSYTLTAKRGSTVIKTDTVSKATPARPTSSGSVAGPATGNASWTECTEKSLSGTNVSVPVSCYVTTFNLAARGYGDGGRINPHLDGTYLGVRACDTSSSSYPSLDWTDVSVANKSWGAGAHSIGAKVGGDCNKTQWYAHSGGSYSSNICWGQVNYWYYSSFERDAELRAHPWWVEELAGREIHIASQVDVNGDTVKVTVTDRRTKAVLVDWEA